MPLHSAGLVAGMFREVERALRSVKGAPAKERREWLFKRSGVDESSYYRYKRGQFSPTIEQMFSLYVAVGLRLKLGVAPYTDSAGETGGQVVAPDVAEIMALLEGLSVEDRERVVEMVHRYAAARGGAAPSGLEPERASGSRVARRKS